VEKIFDGADQVALGANLAEDFSLFILFMAQNKHHAVFNLGLHSLFEARA